MTSEEHSDISPYKSIFFHQKQTGDCLYEGVVAYKRRDGRALSNEDRKQLDELGFANGQTARFLKEFRHSRWYWFESDSSD